jgi:hypothetical protein
MWSYVNHQAMNEIFMPLEAETDPIVRSNLIESIETEFGTRILKEYEKTAFELKKSGWSTGQIAESMGISERKVKKFIALYAERKGELNPLIRHQPDGVVIDITHLIQRSRHPAGRAIRDHAKPAPDPTPATNEPASPGDMLPHG